MKIAMVVPSLANKGPVILVKDIIDQIQELNENIQFTVFYFDEICELSFNCECIKLDFKKKYLFQDFDIIHSHLYRPNKYIARYKNYIVAMCVTTVHCNIFSVLYHTHNLIIAIMFSPLWLYYICKHDRIVTLTQNQKGIYSNLLGGQKISVINNGRSVVPKEINEIDKHILLDIPKDKIILGAFAGLTSIKGIDQVIKVLPYLKQCIFIIIGDGKEKKRLQYLSKKQNVEEQCYFLGYRKDAYRYLKYVDVYMMPSVSEGFPLALIEAAQYGCSCVCSDIKTFTEIWTEKEVSFFKLHDIVDLKRAILVAINKKNEKSNAIRKKYEANYTAKIMAQKYLELYKQITT